MNEQVLRLYSAAGKQTRTIVGLMSGTSLDGLDVALCTITGSGAGTTVRVRQFETIPYTEEIKNRIRRVFAKKEVDFQYLVVLNEWIGRLHGDMVASCLQHWGVKPGEVDCIASHGQTVYHAPRHQHLMDGWPDATLQIGDGDHIAVATGITTVSDFRQKHISAGGEGAPLAVYGDYLLFSSPLESRLMLNMGGIANFTYLPQDRNPEAVFVTDTGPGNTLLDSFTQTHFNQAYDKDALLARKGTISRRLLDALKKNTFFSASFPKTTGPEVFNLEYLRKAQAESDTVSLSGEDVLATLTAFSAETISEAIARIMVPGETYHIYASGGGMHNPLLMSAIQERFPGIQLSPSDALGIPGDAKEAVLFAVLANETLAGGQIRYGARSSVPSVCMGKISFPA